MFQGVLGYSRRFPGGFKRIAWDLMGLLVVPEEFQVDSGRFQRIPGILVGCPGIQENQSGPQRFNESFGGLQQDSTRIRGITGKFGGSRRNSGKLQEIPAVSKRLGKNPKNSGYSGDYG